MQCRHNISLNHRCKNITKNTCGYCRWHEKLYSDNEKFLEDRPQECPVCYNKLCQVTRPLSCGHYVHKSCVIKSGKSECPICRKYIPNLLNKNKSDIGDDTNNNSDNDDSPVLEIEIPNEYINFSVLLFQIYSKIFANRFGSLNLQDFISPLIDDIIPSNLAPELHNIFTNLLAQEAENIIST